MAHLIRPAKLEEAVVALLRAERCSPTSARYLALKGVDQKIIDQPNYDSPKENALRWNALGDRRSVFLNLPLDTAWWAATISGEELAGLFAEDYKAWNLCSGGSRRLLRAAQAIRDSAPPPSKDPTIERELDEIWQAIPAICGALNGGEMIEPLILVGSEQAGPFCVIEGTKRATALCWRHCLESVPCPGVNVLLAIVPLTARERATA